MKDTLSEDELTQLILHLQDEDMRIERMNNAFKKRTPHSRMMSPLGVTDRRSDEE